MIGRILLLANALKVLCDISPLGAAANPHQRGTVGIFRVIEHLAHALLHTPECEPWFYARQNRGASQSYFEANLAGPRPNGAPSAQFAAPALPGSLLPRAVTTAEKFFSEQYVHPPWRWFASGRILWAGTRTMLGGVEEAAVSGLDIYHSPAGPLPAWTRSRSRRRPQRFLTAYDLMPLVRPEYFPTKAAHWQRAIFGSLTPEDWVLCISESTRRDLLEFYPACDPARVLVTPLAAEACFHPERDPATLLGVRKRYGIPADEPYFLSVSTLEPRKNFEGIIRAFTAFVRDDPSRLAQLVLVGGRVREDTEGITAALVESGAEVRARIIFTGYVADADLAALYSDAVAFLYLSFYEGFGLPPLEAMQCGTPVIVSNTSSLPEVVGGGGVLLAPTDTEGVASEMRSLCQDSTRRRQQSERALARASQFSWTRFEAENMAAYRRALYERG